MRESEQGFTLVELMTAVLIIAVLVAIAIPTFIGQTNQARDAGAKGELRDVLPAVKSLIAEKDSALTLEQNIRAVSPTAPLDSTGVDGIKVEYSVDGDVCMWRRSDSGKIFGLWEPATDFGVPTLYAEFTVIPAACPVLTDTAGAGYTSSPW